MRLIDADALKEEVNKKKVVGRFNTLSLIDNAPTVCENNPKWCESCISNGKCASTRTRGRWIKIFSNPFTNGYVCSICGHKIQVTEQFLPKVTECESCGADMRGSKE